MVHNLDDSIALLGRTPAALDAFLRDLPAVWTLNNEGPSPDGKPSFTVRDTVAHLIHADRTDWMPRAHHILDQGESQPLPAFRRFGHIEASEGKPLNALLDEFAEIRAQSLRDLDALGLTPGDLARRGQHPTFAIVTLSELLATWAAHDLTHLHQITRVMAYQYRDAVGPFAKFLGVLHCAGHSAPA